MALSKPVPYHRPGASAMNYLTAAFPFIYIEQQETLSVEYMPIVCQYLGTAVGRYTRCLVVVNGMKQYFESKPGSLINGRPRPLVLTSPAVTNLTDSGRPSVASSRGRRPHPTVADLTRSC